MKPYHFFEHTGDINAPPGLGKTERDVEGQGVHLDGMKKLFIHVIYFAECLTQVITMLCIHYRCTK